jgi:hypothetical protein
VCKRRQAKALQETGKVCISYVLIRRRVKGREGCV